MTQDTEVHEGDVREFRGVVVKINEKTDGASIRFDGVEGTTQMFAEELAASRLISRAHRPIRVGDRVRLRNFGDSAPWSGEVDAICSDGKRAYLHNFRGMAGAHWITGPHFLSDLTLVEGQDDG